MKIRTPQVAGLSDAGSAGFESRLAAFLNDKYPESKSIPEAQFREGIRGEITKARSYGLETEQQIATYVHSSWVLGRDFDSRFPAAAEKLPSPAYSPEQKAGWLAAWTKALFESLATTE